MYVTINGTGLSYTDQGNGLPVLFIHAFPLNRTMWAPQLALSSRCRVITVDLRGHGESQPVRRPFSMDDLASDMKGLLDHLSIGEAVLVGLSMGGYVSFAFYRHYPDRVKALVLADTRAQADSAEAREGRFSMIRTADSQGAAAIAELMLPKLLSPTTLENHTDLVQRVRAVIEQTPVGTIIADLRAMAERGDSTSLLSTIACPTLVLAGGFDRATPPSEVQQMAGNILGSHWKLIDKAGHLPNLEQPGQFNEAILAFLDGLI
jgi:3-oxoadipate enol-lactonase